MRKNLSYSFILLLAVCTVNSSNVDSMMVSEFKKDWGSTPMQKAPIIHPAPTPIQQSVSTSFTYPAKSQTVTFNPGWTYNPGDALFFTATLPSGLSDVVVVLSAEQDQNGNVYRLAFGRDGGVRTSLVYKSDYSTFLSDDSILVGTNMGHGNDDIAYTLVSGQTYWVQYLDKDTSITPQLPTLTLGTGNVANPKTVVCKWKITNPIVPTPKYFGLGGWDCEVDFTNISVSRASDIAAEAAKAKEATAKEEAVKEAEETKEEAALQAELKHEGFKLESGTFKKISVGRKDNKLEAWAIDANGDTYKYVNEERQSKKESPSKDSKSKKVINPWVKQDIKSPVCSIKIIKATYGAGDQPKDVTALLQTQIPSTARTLVLSSQTVGMDQYGSWQNKIFGDPAFGKGKTLTVTYLGSDGVIRSVSVQEKAPLEFSTNPNPVVKLIDIAVSSDGDVVAIRDNFTALKYDWAKNAWSLLPASNQDIVLENITIADDDNIYAVQNFNTPGKSTSIIYKYDVQKTGASWVKISDDTDIINAQKAGASGTSWGNVKSIAAGMSADKKPILIKINKDGEAYELVGSKWVELTGATDLKDITVGSEKYIFAIGKKGSLWKLHYKTKKWIPVNTKKGKQVHGFHSISINAKGMFFALDRKGKNYHRRFVKTVAKATTEKKIAKTEKKVVKPAVKKPVAPKAVK